MGSIKYLLFIFLVLIIILLSYFIINKTNMIVNYKGTKEYNFLYPKSFIAENIDQCPPGCTRGVCDKKDIKGYCVNDYQCSYCADEETNMFYVDFQDRGEILHKYNKNSSNKNTKSLNDRIMENNIYISDLNVHIKDINS